MCSTSINVERIVDMKLFDSHKDMLITIQAIKMKRSDTKDICSNLPTNVDHIRKTMSRSYIRDLILRSTVNNISVKDLFDLMNRSGIKEIIVEEELDNLILSGEVFRPKEGFLRKVDP